MRLWIAAIVLCGFACGHPPEDSSETLGMISSERYPTIPHDDMTPGVLCKNPSEYRYPEKIKYCKRSVSTSLKYRIISLYDERYSYSIEDMNRNEFKIDHLIPLCMGGDNDMKNLWPQHSSVYKLTDFLEERLCTAMARGDLSQNEAVAMIQEAKHDHATIPSIKERVDSIID